MVTKYLMLALSTLALNSKNTGREYSKLEEIKKVIHNEIISIGFKILVGLILTSMIIFSVIELGIVLNSFLNQYENGQAFIILSFGAITVVGLVALFFIFRSTKVSIELNKTHMGSLDVQSLATNFMQGFMEGIEKEKTLQ